MRTPHWVRDFFDWRWAPCVGLTAGSLAFVALALLLIPTRFGGEPRVVSTLSAYETPQAQRAIFSSALARSATGTDAGEHRAEVAANARVARVAPPPVGTGEVSAPAQRGFSPILERAEPIPPPAPPIAPPPAPVAVSAAAEAPAPAPSNLIQPGESREVTP